MSYIYLKVKGPSLVVPHLYPSNDGWMRAEFFIGDPGTYELVAKHGDTEIKGDGYTFTVDIQSPLIPEDQPHCKLSDAGGSGRWIKRTNPIIPFESVRRKPGKDFWNEDHTQFKIGFVSNDSYATEQPYDGLLFQWQPFCCRLVHMSHKELIASERVHQCLRDKWIHFSGDSLSRMMYYELVDAFASEDVKKLTLHNDRSTLISSSNLLISFQWSSHQFSPAENVTFQAFRQNERMPDHWIVNTGAWEAAQGYNTSDYTDSIGELHRFIERHNMSGKTWLRNTYPLQSYRRHDHHEPANVAVVNRLMEQWVRLPILDVYHMAEARRDEREMCFGDGMHWIGQVSRTSANLLLNYLCN